MELKIKDLIELFDVPEKTILKWVKEKNLPSYKINNELKFTKAEISDWALKNNIKVTEKILDLTLTAKPVVLYNLIKKGGIHRDIEGSSVTEIIRKSVDIISTPEELTKEAIVETLLQREELMPTALGRGIAIPHARNPIIADIENESVSICFPVREIDYNSLDGLPVHTLFFVLSANPKRHLEILSKISYLCQQDDFMELLKSKAPAEKIMTFIEEKEKDWNRK